MKLKWRVLRLAICFYILLTSVFAVGEGLLRVKPAFAQSADASFLEHEAGIAAYVNVGQPIDLNLSKTAYSRVDAQGDKYIIGIVDLTGVPNEQSPYVYVTAEGWIVAYYLKLAPASKIMQWYGFDGASITMTTLDTAILKICAGIKSDYSKVKLATKYYHFGYPNATQLTLAAEMVDVQPPPNPYRLPYDDVSGGFTFSVPSTIILHEASWSYMTYDSYRSKIWIDDAINATLKNTKDSETVIMSAQYNKQYLAPNIFHEIGIFHEEGAGYFSDYYLTGYSGIAVVFVSEQVDTVSRVLVESANSVLRFDLKPPILLTNKPPIADAGINQTITPNTVVTLDGSTSHDTDGSITTYEWDFGDGTKGAGKAVTHIYSGIGAYTVILIVTDNLGIKTTDKVTVQVIRENQPPVITSLSTNQAQVLPGATTTISALANDPDNDNLIYRWSTNSGSISGTGSTVVWKAPDKQGTYNINLEVDDGCGGIRGKSISIQVSTEIIVTGKTQQGPYVDLYGHITDVKVGGEIIIYLSAVNPITSPGALVVQLTLRIPSGWSITSSGFGHVVGGISTNTYEIEQGPSTKAIEVHILANEPYKGNLIGYVDYYFKGEETKYHNEASLPVFASLVEPSPKSTNLLPTTPAGNSNNEGVNGTLIAIIIGVCTVVGVLAIVIHRRTRNPVTVGSGISNQIMTPTQNEKLVQPQNEGKKSISQIPNAVIEDKTALGSQVQKGINEEIQERITNLLGSDLVNKLSAYVLDPLIQAEKNFQQKENTSQAIDQYYHAVGSCLGQFFTIKIAPKLRIQSGYDEQQFAKLAFGVNDIRDILLNLDRPDIEKTAVYIKARWTIIRNASIQAFPNLDRKRVEAFIKRLSEIQRIRNRYQHTEGQILTGPIPWPEQRRDLETMRSLVLGTGQIKSAIAEIVEIFK